MLKRQGGKGRTHSYIHFPKLSLNENELKLFTTCTVERLWYSTRTTIGYSRHQVSRKVIATLGGCWTRWVVDGQMWGYRGGQAQQESMGETWSDACISRHGLASSCLSFNIKHWRAMRYQSEFWSHWKVIWNGTAEDCGVQKLALVWYNIIWQGAG